MGCLYLPNNIEAVKQWPWLWEGFINHTKDTVWLVWYHNQTKHFFTVPGGRSWPVILCCAVSSDARKDMIYGPFTKKYLALMSGQHIRFAPGNVDGDTDSVTATPRTLTSDPSIAQTWHIPSGREWSSWSSVEFRRQPFEAGGVCARLL